MARQMTGVGLSESGVMYTRPVPWHNGAGCRRRWKWAHIWRADEGRTVAHADTLLAVTHVAVAAAWAGQAALGGTGGHSACQPGRRLMLCVTALLGILLQRRQLWPRPEEQCCLLQQRDTLEPSTHWQQLKGPGHVERVLGPGTGLSGEQ